jgi:single-stranded DNA-binding protein
MQKEVSIFDVSSWTRLAEVCGEYLKKGRGVRVVGEAEAAQVVGRGRQGPLEGVHHGRARRVQSMDHEARRRKRRRQAGEGCGRGGDQRAGERQ